ncbi:MAG: LptF/LptG family permease, partial [Limnobacter sp.]|nr:LptF/LptG family permease [Limnobacter sp.]
DFTKEGELLDVQFYEMTSELRLTRWVRADVAVYRQAQGHWELSDVEIQNFFEQGDQGAAASGLLKQPQMLWRSSLTPQLLTGLFVRPDRMSAYQLYNYSNFLQSNGQATDNIDLAFAKKVVYPLAIFVMTLISLSFAYLQFRAGAVSVRVFIGVMIGVGFHLVNNLFSHLTMVAKLPPFVSASIPTLIGLVVGLAALWWVSRPAPWMALKSFRKVPRISLETGSES